MSATQPHPIPPFPRMRLALSALLATVCAVLALTTGPALAAPAPTREDIYRQLGVDAVPADYVILVDTSGSMGVDGRYNNVRGVLSNFLSGLTPSDYVALYTFDTRPQRRFGGSAADRNAILNALPQAATQNGKTDIGLAIEQALNELNRADAADIATVVLLTDGKQEAPATSAYRSTDAPAWKTLTTRATALKKTWLGAYALPLSAQTGAALLQTVISGTVVLEPSAGPGLAGYLDQSKQATRLAKARSLLSADTGKGVQVTWTAIRSDPAAGTATLQAKLTSLTQRVPITVSDLHVTAGDGVTWSEPPPSTVTLQPGQTETFTFSARWKPGFSPKLWPHDAAVQPPLSLTGRVGTPWTDALAPDIMLNIPAQPADSSTTRLAKHVGSWQAVAIASGVLALLLLLLAVTLYIRAYPRLSRGTMGIYAIGAGEDFQRIDQFTIRRRRVRHTSQPAAATIKVRGRRVPTTTFVAEHIGLETTLARNDIRGTSSHTIRPEHGGLVGGLYLLHVRHGSDVPARLRVNNGLEERVDGSPWSVPESRHADHDGATGEEPSLWTSDLGDTPMPVPDDTTR